MKTTFNRFQSPLFAAATVLALPAASAATWNGATSASWATAGNWTGTPPDNVTPQPVVYDASSVANLAQSLNGSYTLTGITVGSITGAVTVGHATGNVLTIGSSGIGMSAATQNLSILTSANVAGNIDIAANQTWNVASGRTLTLFNASNTQNARLTGSANIEKTGAGTVLLSVGDITSTGTALDNNGNDTFTGNWTITAGKIQGQRNATHAWGRGGITLNGGTIAQTNGNWTWSNNIDVSAASVIGTDSSNGLGRTLKLLGNLTSSNSSGLTFANSTTGGTRTDDVGFVLAGSAASTYTTTTISANSRVRVGGNATASVTGDGFNAGNRGSLGSGDVTLSAANSELAFTRTDAHTVANNISGLGTVVVGGNTSAQAGTSSQVVTLSGTNTYTGATRVSRSRLNLTGSLTSAVSLDNSGSISGTGSTTGLLTFATGTNIALAGGATTTSLTSNGVTFSGSSQVIFLSAPVSSTVYDVLTYGAGTVTNPGNLLSNYRGTLTNDVTNQKFTFTAGEFGATRTWNTTDGFWEAGLDENFAEGDKIFYSGDIVTFNNPATASTVTLVGTLAPASLTVNNTNDFTFSGSGSLIGAMTLTKTGTGILTLSTANSYTGGTSVSGGTLKLGNAAGLGGGTVTVGSGATLDVAGYAPTNAINLSGTGNGTNPALWNSATTFTSLAGTITLSADATVGHAATDASNSLVLGSLNLNGNKLSINAGSVYLAIQNIPSGNIDINNGGTLYSQNGGTLTSVTGTITINAGGKFETRDTNNTTMTSVHNIALNGGTLATATITNNNGGGGGTTLKNNIQVDATNGGTINGNNTGFGINLRLAGELSGTGPLTLTGGRGVEFRGECLNYTGTATVTGGTLFFNPTTSQSFGGVIAGTRPVVKEGTGTTTLLGANTYTGVTTIRGNNGTSGEVRVSSINNGGVAGNLGQATGASANIVFGQSGLTTGKLVYTGAGESTDRLFTLNGNAIIENNGSGALNFNGTGDIGKTSGILQTLTLGGTNGGSLVANIIKGAGAGSDVAVIKEGAGTWILAGDNTYTGNTTVNAGTLELADDAQLKFVLGATSGTNNAISGAGTATLSGDFVIDTTAADALATGSWTLENVSTLTGPYGSTFSVIGFTDAGGNKWTKANGPTKVYTFDETTGILTLGPAGGFSSWAATNAPGQTVDQDHDGDGVPNGVEYFMGLSGSGFTANPAPNAFKVVSWPKGASYTGVYGTDYAIQVSSDLGIADPWTNVAESSLTIDSDSVDYDLDTAPAGPRKFARLKVTGP
jgi:autotransporter-associated beta strand protein